MTESDTELISGIPEYVEFSTSEPSTVYYTIDGTVPSSGSLMASGKIYLPTLTPSFTLKAIALINKNSSVILEQEYAVDQSNIDKSRLTGDEGISLLPTGEDPIESLSVDADGNDTQSTVIGVQNLDIRSSRSNRIGEELQDGTSKDFINFVDDEIETIVGEFVSSPNDNNVNFNPDAKLVIINGFEESDYESQIVKIINRPHGTMTVTSEFYNEHLEEQPITTGNFVRSMYNPATKKIIFYYMESRENRWIKSIQKVDNPKDIDLTGRMQPGFVFQWIEDRAMSKIF